MSIFKKTNNRGGMDEQEWLAHLVSLCVCNTSVMVDAISDPHFFREKLITSKEPFKK